MVEVAVEVLDGEVGAAAELADDLLGELLLLEAAALAVVDVLLGDLLQSVARQVEARVARVAVQHLVRVVVEAAEAYLAVSFEQLLGIRLVGLGGPVHFLILDEGVQHFHRLVRMPVLEVLQHSHPHQVLPYLGDLLRRVCLTVPLRLYRPDHSFPACAVFLVDHQEFPLPQFQLPLHLAASPQLHQGCLVPLHHFAQFLVLVVARQVQFDFLEPPLPLHWVGGRGSDAEGEGGRGVAVGVGVGGRDVVEVVAGQEGARSLEQHVDEGSVGEEVVVGEEAGGGVGLEGEGLKWRLLEYTVGSSNILEPQVVLRSGPREVAFVETLPPPQSLAVAACNKGYTWGSLSSSACSLSSCLSSFRFMVSAPYVVPALPDADPPVPSGSPCSASARASPAARSP